MEITWGVSKKSWCPGHNLDQMIWISGDGTNMCWSQLGSQQLLRANSAHVFPTLCLVTLMVVAGNWQWWEYLHHRNGQTLQIRAFYLLGSQLFTIYQHITGVGAWGVHKYQYFLKLPRRFQCAAKFENQWSRHGVCYTWRVIRITCRTCQNTGCISDSVDLG